jgi:hypothetical protein
MYLLSKSILSQTLIDTRSAIEQRQEDDDEGRVLKQSNTDDTIRITTVNKKLSKMI